MPCPGKIEGLRLPEGLGLRNDCGVYEGAEVPIYYDPMIAKLITWGENRVEAILRMRRALARIPSARHQNQYFISTSGSCATRASCPETSIPASSKRNTAPSNSEEVLPHKEIALASAAIAALHREQEQTLGLLPEEPPNRRSGASRASAIRCAATKVSQAAAGAARKA